MKSLEELNRNHQKRDIMEKISDMARMIIFVVYVVIFSASIVGMGFVIHHFLKKFW